MDVHENGEIEFRIVSKAFDSWNVQFRIDVAELLDQQILLRHLRRIKQEIARMHSLPEVCMIFDRIVRKTRSDDSVDVVVCIKKVLFEKSNPKVGFKEGVGSDGTLYANMTALLDLFYLDKFEKAVTQERVMHAVAEAKIAPDLLDTGMITRKVLEVLDSRIPIKEIPIATGQFPAIGNDALLDFYFQAVVEPGKTDEYYSSRRVSRGDMLCRKIPASVGAVPGRNVCGDVLPPRAGLDIELKTLVGAELSLDGNEAVADIDGVAVVTRVMRRVSMLGRTKEIPQTILVKVNPVMRVEGNRVLDIASSQTVEIVGNLTMGSKILTDCEVYVSGDVEPGTLIQAADDITIEGQVRGATLQSETNVIAQQNVADTTIAAREKVIIKGTIRNSDVTGDSVSANIVAGSRIVARRSVTAARVDADENNILSTICVGMFDFFKERIRENETFLERARENLTRIEMLVGSEITLQVTASNIQTMLMRFLSRNRLGQDTASRKQVVIYRQLIESIPPTRTLIAQKERENLDLLKRIGDKERGDGAMIVIREKMSANAILSVDGVEAEVQAQNSAVKVTADSSNNLIVDRRGNADHAA